MRNLSAEKQEFLRMYLRCTLAEREYTERHFKAAPTQDSEACKRQVRVEESDNE
jgi:hypothetical protein